MAVAQRLLKELRASPPKTAALGVLLLIGLCVWLPPLWRAIQGTETTGVATANRASVNSPAAAATVNMIDTAVSYDSTRAATTGVTGLDWEEAERLRETDTLFRPAEPQEIRENAFTLRGDFLPIEAELAVDPKKPPPILAKTPPPKPPALSLRSTLVGPDRRAALINGRIYPEGSVIPAGGINWTLKTVEPRRVLLVGDGRTHELKIDPFASSRNRIGR